MEVSGVLPGSLSVSEKFMMIQGVNFIGETHTRSWTVEGIFVDEENDEAPEDKGHRDHKEVGPMEFIDLPYS